MPTHTAHTPLAATPQQAYDYLTVPACWHEWHAASLGTEPDAHVSQPKGATFEENIRTAGFRRRLHWRVVDAQRPDHWEAAATMDDGSRVRLRYDFAANGEGTRFTRTLDYTVRPWWLRVVDAVFGRLRIRRESTAALAKLQRHFEQRAGG
ncbi:MAG TPA: SRPBCC family protein [Tahibacter sp.]|nr:SRPBCC family protein [Tahibacter sp.]